MDSGSWLWVGLLGLGVLLAALAAAAEMALASVNRLELRRLLEGGGARARTTEALFGTPARLLATLLVTKISGYVLVVTTAMFLIWRYAGAAQTLWGALGVTALLVLAQILPRAWVVGRQERVAIWLAPFIRVLMFVLAPITGVLQRIGHRAIPEGTAAESIFLSEDGLRFLMTASEEETTIEDDEKEMIASIFEFNDKLVREVMVPRIDVGAVQADTPMLEALGVILKDGHSRIPIYKDSVDNIIGILHAKDLLHYLRDGRTEVPLSRILRSAYFIPESKKVNELLQELQQRKVHMAIVVDEYGGTAGIITIEDLLEEIVGEIQDEYDAEEPTIEPVNEYEYLFDARVRLDNVSKLLGVDLPEDGGDTLGGFIYSQLGKVPAVADRVEFNDVTFEVLSVAGRRIKQVRACMLHIEPLRQPAGDVTNAREPEPTDERPGESFLVSNRLQMASGR